MLSLSDKQAFLAALTAAFLLVLIAFFTVPASVPHALQVSILEQTNTPSAAPMALVSVTNHTGQARFFYLLADVPTPNGGWTAADRQQRVRHRLAAHAECCASPQVPAGATRWKFRCTSMREVRKPEGFWYLFVRRTGLSRVGFRDRPPESYVWTTEMSL